MNVRVNPGVQLDHTIDGAALEIRGAVVRAGQNVGHETRAFLLSHEIGLIHSCASRRRSTTVTKSLRKALPAGYGMSIRNVLPFEILLTGAPDSP